MPLEILSCQSKIKMLAALTLRNPAITYLFHYATIGAVIDVSFHPKMNIKSLK